MNDYVKIKLTPVGKKILFDYYLGQIDIDSITDENGYTKIQLWEMMNAFGKYTFNGTTTDWFANTSVIFEDSILTNIPIGYIVRIPMLGHYLGPHHKYHDLCSIGLKKYAKIFKNIEDADKELSYYYYKEDYEIIPLYDYDEIKNPQ